MKRLGAAVALAFAWVSVTPAAAAPVVVAQHLDRPRGLAVGPDGTLYAALVGRGGKPCNREGCFGATGRVVRVHPDGTLATVGGGLLSMRGVPDGFFSIGADNLAVMPDGRIATAITAEFQGDRPRAPKAVPKKVRNQIGHVVFVGAGGRRTLGADIAAVEYRHDPDKNGPVSNPYGIALLGDTLYVSDSAGNDLLAVHGTKVDVIAVFPPAGDADPVPDALAAGPDGALYVGEFTGGTQARGTARIWRVVPGQPPVVLATGLTSISALAFGPDGSLYAAEFVPGDVVRIAPDGTRTTLGGLHFPGGVAVTPDGALYVSNWSVAGAKPRTKGELKGRTGQIVRLS